MSRRGVKSERGMGGTPRIAVVGSVNADLITHSERVPRPGETLFSTSFDLDFGGKGANQAIAARLCGADVAMIAKVGRDLFGDASIRNFEAFGIDTTHVLRVPAGVSTGVATIIVESTGQNRILVVKGANALLTPADVDAAAPLLRAVDLIILQFEVPLETIYYTLDLAHRHGIPCLVNPAPALRADLKKLITADYFIPNETEAEILTGLPVDTIDAARSCAAALIHQGFSRVVLTLGERGALFADGSDGVHVAPFEVAAVDTAAAGDAFIGSLAVFLAQGVAPVEAVLQANLYAALSTTQRGTQRSFPQRKTFEAEWARRSRERH
jgi:ribokinase